MVQLRITIFWLFLLLVAKGQTAEYKSKNLQSLPDTSYINFLNRSAADSLNINPNYTEKAALESEELSRKVGYKKGLEYALYNLANLDMNRYKSQNSIERCILAIDFAKQLNDSFLLGKAYNVLGIDSSDLGHYKESIRCYKKSLSYTDKTKDSKTRMLALINLGVSYTYLSDYEKSVENYLLGLKIVEERNDTSRMITVLNNLSSVYSAKQSYGEALRTIHKALSYAQKYKNANLLADCYNNLFTEYSRADSLDKAIPYCKKAVEIYQKQRDNRRLSIAYNNLAVMYKKFRDYDKTLEYCLMALETIKKTDMISEQPFYLYTLADAYINVNSPDKATYYSLQSIKQAKQFGINDVILKNYFLLANLYNSTGRYKQSAEYYACYVSLNDSLSKLDFENSIAEMNAKYETEKKEKEIVLLSSEKDRQQLILEKRKKTITVLFAAVLLTIITTIFVIRQNKIRQKQKAATLEQKLLRVQMNPHFIFNSLVAIQSFLQKQSPETAGVYIGKFSRLMRLILENSRCNLISIEKEVETLELYLEMQRMRFSNNFEYSITLPDDPEFVENEIPPMIAQPFVENSIEHGFLRSNIGGVLRIRLFNDSENLCLEVEDNGVGIEKSSDKLKNHKSLAMEITRERLSLISKHASLNIIDLSNEGKNGTLVRIKIPLKNN